MIKDMQEEKKDIKSVEDCISFINKRHICTHHRFLTILDFRTMTQSDLANKLGVHRAYISRIINSKEKASLHMKIRIAQALGVDSALLFYSEDLPPSHLDSEGLHILRSLIGLVKKGGDTHE